MGILEKAELLRQKAEKIAQERNISIQDAFRIAAKEIKVGDKNEDFTR